MFRSCPSDSPEVERVEKLTRKQIGYDIRLDHLSETIRDVVIILSGSKRQRRDAIKQKCHAIKEVGHNDKKPLLLSLKPRL